MTPAITAITVVSMVLLEEEEEEVVCVPQDGVVKCKYTAFEHKEE